MKKQMLEISQRMRILDRAIDLCENENLLEALEEQREELKNEKTLRKDTFLVSVMAVNNDYSNNRKTNLKEQLMNKFTQDEA